MDSVLGLSYPTIRSRLHEIIRALGYEPGKDETSAALVNRRTVLDDLDSGAIGFEEAMSRLRGESRP